MKDSEFVFDYVHLLYYKVHKINASCNGSYIDFLDWIKNKKATIKKIIVDNCCICKEKFETEYVKDNKIL